MRLYGVHTELLGIGIEGVRLNERHLSEICGAVQGRRYVGLVIDHVFELGSIVDVPWVEADAMARFWRDRDMVYLPLGPRLRAVRLNLDTVAAGMKSRAQCSEVVNSRTADADPL